MAVEALLGEITRRGILADVDGDQLRIEAPVGALTPELRDALVAHKPTLLAALAPPRGFIALRPDRQTGQALTFPVDAIALAITLELRGFAQTLDAAGDYRVSPDAGLTDRERAAIARWRRHLTALVAYEPPEVQ